MELNKSLLYFYVYFVFLTKYVMGSNLRSLTFVIDNTGSMGDDIYAVKNNVKKISEPIFKGNNTHIDNVIVITFNDYNDHTDEACDDPSVELRANTRDQMVFEKAVDELYTHDGARSCPECSMSGIKLGIEKSLPGSYIFVFTDAGSKDFYMSSEVKRLALEKKCEITFILSTPCEGHRISAKYAVYYDVANVTGGLVFHVEKAEVKNIMEYMSIRTESPTTPLTSKTLPAGKSNITVNTDALMGDVLISVTSNTPSLTTSSIKIKDPEGNDVPKKIIFSTYQNMLYAINATSGHFTMLMDLNAQTNINVMAKSGLEVDHGFSSIKPDSLEETSILPAPDADTYLSIKVKEGNVELTSAKLLDANDNVIKELPLEKVNDATKFYTTAAFYPPDTFKLSVVGYNTANNETVTRTMPAMIETKKLLPGEKVQNISPKVEIKGDTMIYTKYGEQLNLTCKVDGFPQPNITWKNLNTGAEFSTETKPGNNYPKNYISILETVASSDATYACIASNPVGSDSKDVVVKIITYLNVSTPSENITVMYEKEGKIVCMVDAFPHTNITWYKDSTVLNNKTDNIEINETHKNSILVIKNATLVDEGKYSCIATNEQMKKTVTVMVTIGGLEEPQIAEPISDKLTVTRGFPTKLECRITKGKPKPAIKWYHQLKIDDKKSTKDFKEIPEWKNQELINTKAVHSGKYRCEAVNKVLNETKHVYLNYDLVVEYKPKIVKRSFKKSFIKGTFGLEISVPCSVDASPAPQVTWFKNGEELVIDGKPYIYDNVTHALKFVPDFTHAGNYTCKATNKLGTDSATTRVHVRVPARVKQVTQSFSVPEGSDVRLPCTGTGRSVPKIRWTYKSNDSTHEKIITPKEGADMLHIPYIKASEAGFYKCVVLNAAGSMAVLYEVQVHHDPPAITNLYAENKFEVMEGDSELRINCNASGYPVPSVTWTKDGSNVGLGSTYFVENDTLIIKNVTKDASGLYKCEAKSLSGADQEIYEVVVIGGSQQDGVSHSVSGIDIIHLIEIGHSTNLVCPQYNNDIPDPDTIQWYYMGKQLDSQRGQLVISDAKPSQSGYYSCRVSTATMSYSDGVYIIVGYKPIFSDTVQTNILLYGSIPVELDCLYESEPAGKVTWYLNDKKLPSTAPVYTSNDEGEYKCEVNNEFGTSTRVFNVYTNWGF